MQTLASTVPAAGTAASVPSIKLADRARSSWHLSCNLSKPRVAGSS